MWDPFPEKSGVQKTMLHEKLQSEFSKQPSVWVHLAPWLESHPPQQVPLKQPIELVQHLGGHWEPKRLWDHTHGYSVWPKSSHVTRHEQPEPFMQEPKRKCDMTKGKVLVEGDGVNDDLTNIELLSKQDGVDETSNRLTNLGTIGQGIKRI